MGMLLAVMLWMNVPILSSFGDFVVEPPSLNTTWYSQLSTLNCMLPARGSFLDAAAAADRYLVVLGMPNGRSRPPRTPRTWGRCSNGC